MLESDKYESNGVCSGGFLRVFHCYNFMQAFATISHMKENSLQHSLLLDDERDKVVNLGTLCTNQENVLYIMIINRELILVGTVRKNKNLHC